MSYKNPEIETVARNLKEKFVLLPTKAEILKDTELKALFDAIVQLPKEQRAAYGRELNSLRAELQRMVDDSLAPTVVLPPIDVTAPFDINVPPALRPQLLPTKLGSMHPLMAELERVLEIFYRMGFTAIESREIDDEYHMFGALNFPEGHPARDDYDTFLTIEKDQNGRQYIAPAHTSTMQNRVLQNHRAALDSGKPIAVVIPGRVFRNEDLDVRHEHTFYQLEGVYVGKGINAGNLIATLKVFLQEYFQKDLEVKTQPYYFPFTEPSFEFAVSCPFCDQKGCKICSYSGWIELLGCGMIHPNVLREANINPEIYTGFAWGSGIERLVMMKYGIEDIRHFESGKLDFLRQFA